MVWFFTIPCCWPESDQQLGTQYEYSQDGIVVTLLWRMWIRQLTSSTGKRRIHIFRLSCSHSTSPQEKPILHTRPVARHSTRTDPNSKSCVSPSWIAQRPHIALHSSHGRLRVIALENGSFWRTRTGGACIDPALVLNRVCGTERVWVVVAWRIVTGRIEY